MINGTPDKAIRLPARPHIWQTSRPYWKSDFMPYSSNHDLEDEIRRLVNAGDIQPEQALRLILASNAETLKVIKNIREEQDELQDRLTKLEGTANRYPSMLWLWSYRRRELIVILMIVFIVYTFLIAPWIATDIHTMIREALHLPDISIIPAPTP